jgi:UDP-GlcNAc:undecaprenyl-phosphate GlcNAc-1-phosphate transferase
LNQIILLIIIFILSSFLTLLFKTIITWWGGNLYTSLRGGTPRAVGLAPFLVLIIFFPPPGNYLIAIIGVFAFVDDLIGRKKINVLPVEFGQLSRGIGILLVMIVGFYYFGPAAILIALMIQPINIADMQPGAACSTVIIMSLILGFILYLTTGNPYSSALIILAACLGYAPFDYMGKIMMGEVGNHSFGVGLGIIYALLGFNITNYHGWGSWGVFLVVLILLIITSILIAFIRRVNLKYYLEDKLLIPEPRFSDYVMDVLTGGGLGDLIRRILLNKKEIIIKKRIYKLLGFRRLVLNPYSKKRNKN